MSEDWREYVFSYHPAIDIDPEEIEYRKWILERGLPEDIEKRLTVTLPVARANAPYDVAWVHENPAAPFTVGQLQEIAEFGLGLTVFVSEDYDASALMAFIEAGGKALSLHRWAAKIRGTARILENAPNLRILRTSGGAFDEWPSSYHLPKLEVIQADTEPLHEACALPTIRNLYIEDSASFDGSKVQGALEFLQVVRCPRFVSLSQVNRLDQLLRLVVTESPAFDFERCGEAKLLEDIRITNIDWLQNLNTLLLLGNLQSLHLEEINLIEDLNVLARVKVNALSISPNYFYRDDANQHNFAASSAAIDKYSPRPEGLAKGYLSRNDFTVSVAEFGHYLEFGGTRPFERRIRYLALQYNFDGLLVDYWVSIFLSKFTVPDQYEFEFVDDRFVFYGKSAAAMRRLRDLVLEVWNDDDSFHELTSAANAASRLEA